MSSSPTKKENGGALQKQFTVHMVDDEKSPNKSGPATPSKVQEEVKEDKEEELAKPSKAGLKSKFFKKKDKKVD